MAFGCCTDYRLRRSLWIRRPTPLIRLSCFVSRCTNSPGCFLSYRTTTGSRSRSFSRPRPNRLNHTLTVETASFSSWAICSPVHRRRLNVSMRHTSPFDNPRGLRPGRLDRSTRPPSLSATQRLTHSLPVRLLTPIERLTSTTGCCSRILRRERAADGNSATIVLFARPKHCMTQHDRHHQIVVELSRTRLRSASDSPLAV